jgi:uncharacterized Tic20 family protein
MPGTEEEKKAHTWGMACHLIALIGFLGIPFGHLLGPLVLWLCMRDSHPFVDSQGKEALNFQLSMTIYGIAAGVLCLVLIGFVLLPAVVLADLVLLIIAAVKAGSGIGFRYPLTIRFIP